MDLYLIRHARAEDREIGRGDAERALTRDGKKRFQRCARGLERLGVGFDRIHHSPLLRALETADLLVPLCDGETIVTLHLARAPAQALLDELERSCAQLGASGVDADAARIALVGHEPYLSQLCAWLAIGWRVFDDPEQAGLLQLEKGGVAHLSGDPRPGAMTLRSLWTPAALREIGKR